MDDNVLGPVGGESVVQKVINIITDAILSGKIKPGDRLPPELELIETLRVSRNTLRSAVQTLRAYGVLEVRRPEGTFVCDHASPNMLNPMLYSIILSKGNASDDLVGLRNMIDIGVSKLVIQNGLTEEEESHLEELYEELVKELRAENPDLCAVAEADLRFHDAVARATHNELAVMFNQFLLNITEESRRRTIQHIFDDNDMEYLVETHRRHLDALENKPGSDIDEALNFSYYYWKQSYKM